MPPGASLPPVDDPAVTGAAKGLSALISLFIHTVDLMASTLGTHGATHGRLAAFALRGVPAGLPDGAPR